MQKLFRIILIISFFLFGCTKKEAYNMENNKKINQLNFNKSAFNGINMYIEYDKSIISARNYKIKLVIENNSLDILYFYRDIFIEPIIIEKIWDKNGIEFELSNKPIQINEYGYLPEYVEIRSKSFIELEPYIGYGDLFKYILDGHTNLDLNNLKALVNISGLISREPVKGNYNDCNLYNINQKIEITL